MGLPINCANVEDTGHTSGCITNRQGPNCVFVVEIVLAVVLVYTTTLHVSVCIFDGSAVWNTHDEDTRVHPSKAILIFSHAAINGVLILT